MSAQLPQVTIQDTEVHRLSSTHVDQKYNILVALPPGYADSDKTYPTLYATDGDLILGGLAQIARLVAFNKTLPQLVVVGIGYPVHWTKTQPFRVRDYVPAGWRPEHPSGQAGRFLGFVCEELMPWVETDEEEARIANMRRLCQTLEGRGYDGLHLTLRVFEGQTHQSVLPYFLAGLNEVYS